MVLLTSRIYYETAIRSTDQVVAKFWLVGTLLPERGIHVDIY